MERLRAHFENAVCSYPSQRQIGLEIETLIIDSESKPIDPLTSQNLMRRLANQYGWQIMEIKNGQIVKLQKHGFRLIYELGWSNFELISPAFGLDQDFLRKTRFILNMISQAAQDLKARALEKSWDRFRSNTLMMPDRRDEIWLALDGPALFGLGHIASIQFNIDLASIDEAMDWIKKLTGLYERKNWPFVHNFQIWRDYIANSTAKYEKSRYALPPKTFEQYLKQLSELKVVMHQHNGTMQIAADPQPFSASPQVNIELFLRSVWWYFRLRVRNRKLVLEIRDIPRWLGIEKSWQIIKQTLDL